MTAIDARDDSNKKASLEGMSEAFGPCAEARGHENAAREEKGAAISLRPYAAAARNAQTRNRQVAHAQMHR